MDELILSQQENFKSLAGSAILSGEIVEHCDTSGEREFIVDANYLRDNGIEDIESITYTPPYILQGEPTDAMLCIKFKDPHVDKTVWITQDRETGEITEEVSLEPKKSFDTYDISAAEMQTSNTREDNFISEMGQRLLFYISDIDTTPSPEDEMTIHAARQKLSHRATQHYLRKGRGLGGP